jgi:hypothetical protein
MSLQGLDEGVQEIGDLDVCWRRTNKRESTLIRFGQSTYLVRRWAQQIELAANGASPQLAALHTSTAPDRRTHQLLEIAAPEQWRTTVPVTVTVTVRPRVLGLEQYIPQELCQTWHNSHPTQGKPLLAEIKLQERLLSVKCHQSQHLPYHHYSVAAPPDAAAPALALEQRVVPKE